MRWSGWASGDLFTPLAAPGGAHPERDLADRAAGAPAVRQRLRDEGGSDSERQAVQAKVAELERLHTQAQADRARHEEAFGHEMEVWGKAMSARGAEFGDEMQAWAEGMADTQRLRQELRQRQQQESARRDQERGRREDEALKRADEKMKRDAERLHREADRLMEQANRRARQEAEAPAAAAPGLPAAPTMAPTPAAPAKIQP
jgi:hypothetical protein